MQSWMKVLMVCWCWNCNHVLPGLKCDELQRCYFDSVVIGRVFSQLKVMREECRVRETSAEIRGSLVNGKTRPQPGTKLRGPGASFIKW